MIGRGRGRGLVEAAPDWCREFPSVDRDVRRDQLGARWDRRLPERKPRVGDALASHRSQQRDTGLRLSFRWGRRLRLGCGLLAAGQPLAATKRQRGLIGLDLIDRRFLGESNGVGRVGPPLADIEAGPLGFIKGGVGRPDPFALSPGQSLGQRMTAAGTPAVLGGPAAARASLTREPLGLVLADRRDPRHDRRERQRRTARHNHRVSGEHNGERTAWLQVINQDRVDRSSQTRPIP